MRGDELAKGWLLALVEDAPLESAAAIMAGDVTRDGPRICDAVTRAICDEADLRRIEAGGVLEPLVSRAGELAAARTSEDAAHAVEALRTVVWSALRAELEPTDPDLLADAGERLSLVAELVRGAVLRGRASAEAGGAADDGAGDARWIGALRDEIVRAARARLPLSLLLVELAEAERLLSAEPRGEASTILGRVAQTVRTALRHRDLLACETESRAWIIARDTGRAGAQALGSRIAAEVSSGEPWRGAPLTVSVGLAVLGEDGHNAAALIDAAEQMKFAAEASGIGIVTQESVQGGSEPSTPGPSLVS